MALNITSQVVSSALLSASFTTDIAWQKYQTGSFHVVWGGANGSTSTVRLQAFNFGATAATGVNLTALPSTLSVEGSTGSYLFNLTDVGYDYVRLVYAAGNTTTGSMNVYVSRKDYGA